MKRFIFFFLISFSSSAQLREVAEVSFILPDGINEDIQVVPVNEDIALVNFQEDFFKREQKVVLLRYNSNLQLTWTGSAPLPRFFIPVSFVVSGQSVYYLAREREGKKFHLLQFDLESETVTASDFESITPLENIGFTVFNGRPLISGTYNLKPVVEMHNLADKTAKVLPDIYNKNNELRGIFINAYRDELYVFSSIRQNCQMQVATYDESGKLLSRRSMGDKKHRIRQLEVRTGSDGEPFVLGTYNSACLDMTEGLFAGSLDQPQGIRYHSVAALPGYRASLSDKKRRKLQLKKERGRSSGEVRQKAMFHVPVSGLNGFLLATEFYNTQAASTRSLPVDMADAGGKTLNFSEYKVWRILLAELDPAGNVTYDRLYKMEGEVFRGLHTQSAFLFKNDEFYTFLPLRNRLIYAGADKPEYHTLLTPAEGFRISDTDASLFNLNINSFIAHGVADIRPVGVDAASRQIYFIKKYAF